MNCAYVTLATNEEYLFLATYLQASLKIQQSKYPLIVMITEDLKNSIYLNYFDKIVIIPHLQFKYIANNSKKYVDTINKFYAYTLIQFNKIILLDADIMLLENIDSLFNLSENFVCSTYTSRMQKEITHFPFNAIMLIQPSLEIYNTIINNIDDSKYTDDESIIYYLLYPKQFQNQMWDNECNIFENLSININIPIFIHTKKIQYFLRQRRIFPKHLELIEQKNFLTFIICMYMRLIKKASGIPVQSEVILTFLKEQGSLRHFKSTGL